MSAVNVSNDGWARRELRALLTAVQYFTRIPVPGWVGHSAAQLERASRYFPLVGIAIGACGAATLWLCSFALPPLIAVTLATVVTILLTGAFHEDGLADTFDGLGGSLSRERALEIMKDSRVGTFGVLALILALLLKVGTLANFVVRDAMLALIAGHGLSRACAVALAWRLPYSREDASTRAKPVVERIGALDVAVAILCGIAPLFLLGGRAAIALAAALLILLLLQSWFRKRLGGYTGDTLGATQQLTEVAFYLGLLGAWNSY